MQCIQIHSLLIDVSVSAGQDSESKEVKDMTSASAGPGSITVSMVIFLVYSMLPKRVGIIAEGQFYSTAGMLPNVLSLRRIDFRMYSTVREQTCWALPM